MDARERWQALQARLTAARAAVDAGDRATALAEITAALELDAEFLAAHELRDRIAAMAAAPSHPRTPLRAPAHPAPTGPFEGYAKFEQRARRRRVDRRIDAARAAIEQQRLKAAAAALDEVIDLDPNVPELAELTARFDELRRAAATPRRGPWLAAAVVFAIALFGGSWLEDSSPMLSRQIVSAAPLPALPTPAVTPGERFEAVGTTAMDDAALVTQALLGYRWTADAADAPVGFDSCDPRVQGDAATAVCHAGAGAWTVTLRKVGASWKVESARAERYTPGRGAR